MNLDLVVNFLLFWVQIAALTEPKSLTYWRRSLKIKRQTLYRLSFCQTPGSRSMYFPPLFPVLPGAVAGVDGAAEVALWHSERLYDQLHFLKRLDVRTTLTFFALDGVKLFATW